MLTLTCFYFLSIQHGVSSKSAIVIEIVDERTLKVRDSDAQEYTVILDGIQIIDRLGAFNYLTHEVLDQIVELEMKRDGTKVLYLDGIDLRHYLIDKGYAKFRTLMQKSKKTTTNLEEKRGMSANVIGVMFFAAILFGLFQYQRAMVRRDQQQEVDYHFIQSLNNDHGISQRKVTYLIVYALSGIFLWCCTFVYVMYKLIKSKWN